MVDYDKLKDKLRREAQDEQNRKLQVTAQKGEPKPKLDTMTRIDESVGPKKIEKASRRDLDAILEEMNGGESKK